MVKYIFINSWKGRGVH